MSRFDNLAESFGRSRKRVEQLLAPDDPPEPQAFTHSSNTRFATNADVTRPEDNLEEYWRLYETNPLISFPIDTLASKVIEPGWYITADSEDTADELTEFMEQVAIVTGEPHQNFSTLAEQAVVQHEVKGTFLCEDVRNGDGKPVALNPLQVDTFEVYTKPGTNILLAPDDTDQGEVKKTEDGRAAAYVQFDGNDPRWSDRKEKRFARDQIIKWTRGKEVGEVFGTSRVESVYERALALEAKLRDNDDAIAMKAWPMVLFQMGSEDNPWRRQEIEDFMVDFDAENFGPGLMKAVSGDVSIEEFAGETADIESSVETDVNFIMAGMPGPKFALGGFSTEAAQAVAEAQDRQYTKQVRRLRRQLEDKFTPYLQDVAEEYGLDSPDSVELHIQRPDGEVAPEDVSGSIIRYTTDADTGEQKPVYSADGDGDGTVGEGSGNEQPAAGTPENVAMEEPPVMVPEGSTELLADGPVCSDGGCTVEELADPRLTSTQELEDELTETIYGVLTEARNETLHRVQGRYDTATDIRHQRALEIAESAFADASARADLTNLSGTTLREVAERTFDTLEQDNHGPPLDVTYASRHARIVERAETTLRDDIQDAGDDLTKIVRYQHAQAADGGETIEAWASRVRDELDNGTLRSRARVIAQMRIQRVVNAIKLREYERTEAVSGVRVINPCTETTTELCEHLGGCGTREPATARFDADRSIGEQLSDGVSQDLLFEGFTPLPAPPFHYGCRSELVPLLE